VVRLYARIAGILFILIGIIGVLLGDGSLWDIVNSDVPEDVIHLATGALLLYAGFWGADSLARSIVGGVGVVYLLLGLLGSVNDELFGLLPDGYTIVDNVLHLVAGGLGVALAWVVGRRVPATA
jgi:hypothetical protein